MKTIFVTLFAVALASAFPNAPIYAQGPPPGQPYIQIPIPGVPGFGQQPPGGPPGGRERATTESSGSIASGSGTENTTFASA